MGPRPQMFANDAFSLCHLHALLCQSFFLVYVYCTLIYFLYQTGKVEAGDFESESDSSADAIQAGKTKRNNKRTEVKKRKRPSKKRISANKKHGISITDLVSIYEHRDMPEISNQTDNAIISRKKTEQILCSFTKSAGVEEIESEEMESGEMKNLKIQNGGYSDDSIEVDASYNSFDQSERKVLEENNTNSCGARFQVYELPQIQGMHCPFELSGLSQF